MQLSRQGVVRTIQTKAELLLSTQVRLQDPQGKSRLRSKRGGVDQEGKPERVEINGNFAISRNDAEASLPALQTHLGISDNVLHFSEGKQE